MELPQPDQLHFIQSTLQKLYPNVVPALHHKDAFTLLVAVVLSARSRDSRVNQITPKLFELADTPEKMANMQFEWVKKIIQPCGLSPFKARSIIDLSRILIEKYGGQVPGTFEDLESLPGVGHKTASVVMVQWFKIPAFPVDTHIFRLARRWRISLSKNIRKVEDDLKQAFPTEYWHDIHLQMIYYGREHCTARGCDGTKCIICKGLNGL